jgi:MFS transporter, DHA1 family, multidrug resistance protein
MSQNVEATPGMAATDEPPVTADIFSGNATEGATAVGASARERAEAAHHGRRVLAILSALMAFAGISTDLYLPAIPAMGKSLGVNTGMIELTVSGYLIGFSLGQLLWGPIGDRYGRRLPVTIGLVFFVIGSAGCALAGSAWALIVWRVVQALGACASVVLARAMVRDLYTGERAAQMMSTLMTVMAIAPLVGPIVGGQILTFASWRAIFWTLVGVGISTLLALFTLPETLARERRNGHRRAPPSGRRSARNRAEVRVIRSKTTK